MSVKIPKNELNKTQLEKIKDDCFVVGNEGDYGPPQTVEAWIETINSIFVPFSYAQEILKRRQEDNKWNKTNFKFLGNFKNEQQSKVFDQALEMLKNKNSSFLALHCGFGKCFGIDTQILMYDLSIKKVQDVCVNDLIMGDDHTYRKVIRTVQGQDIMYMVKYEGAGKYIVNSSHILSLRLSKNKTIIPWPSGDPSASRKSIATWRVKWYDHLHHKFKKEYLKCEKRLAQKYLDSIYSPDNVDITISHYLELEHSVKKYLHGYKAIPGWDTPLYKISIVRMDKDSYYGFVIDGNRRFLLSDYTVVHNTFEGIKLAHSSQLKTAVLAHRTILIDQWIGSIRKFTTAKVQVVDTTGVLDPNADFYIFNTAFVPKLWSKEKRKWVPKNIGSYKNIGLLIVDEAHIACASEMSKALMYFQPQLVLALTATPRKDGLDKVLDLHFGEEKIIRIAQDPFFVYRLPTGIKPEFKMNKMGKKDWNSVIESLSFNKKRNELIVKLVVKFKEKTILILTKRKDQCTILTNMLKMYNQHVTSMKGTEQTYDKTARILVSTFSKSGIGFDDVRFDMFILGCDVGEIEQYAGRLRHTDGKERVVVDLVDDDGNCQQHWLSRRKWYLSRNGEIKNYYDLFPTEKPKKIEKPVEHKRLARSVKK